MTNRDKLVELLESHCAVIGEVKCKAAKEEICSPRDCAECLADHLIANGVVVQQWISVKDRLPEDSAEVNVFTRSRIVGSGYYDKYTKRWVQYAAGGAFYADVTHWHPLPEPPKEETK